jgi:hypothetical protein
MRISSEEWDHPTQASSVRLSVFQQPDGFLVTEERRGTVTVVKMLGLFERREDALGRVLARGQELARQRYQPRAPAA